MVKAFDSKFVTFVLIIIYRILLDSIYVNITNDRWWYSGFVIDNDNYILSWIILLSLAIPITNIYGRKDLFYPEILTIIFLMRFVPITTLIRYIDLPIGFIGTQYMYMLLMLLLGMYLKPIKMKPLIVFRNSRIPVTFIVLGVMTLSVIFISGYYAHFRLHLSFTDVYELRAEARTFDMPVVLAYLWGATTNVLPVLLIYYLKHGRKLICLFIVMVIILNFSINGMKSTVFKLFLCLMLMHFDYHLIKKSLIYFFVIVVGVALVEVSLFETSIFHDIVLRRAFFIPPLLDTYYYDYISQNGILLYDRSISNGVDIQYVIGNEYFDDVFMDCNNGLFSDAYMNLGVLGGVLYPIILVFFFKCCSNAFQYNDKSVIAFAAIIMSYTFEGSEFTTALLTHGLFLLCITLYINSSEIYFRKTKILKRTLQIVDKSHFK